MEQRYRGIQAYIQRIRHGLHQIPEVGLILPQTSAYIQRELTALNIPFQTATNCSGILATISGKYPGKTIALRADMDALPLQEETSLSYASTHPGVMHACGHDAHMAILLGAARLLSNQTDQLHGNVKLIFQPGEELARGAEVIIREGFLQDVDAIYGMHIGNLFGKDIPSGTFVIPPGCCMASFDRFILHIRGKSCHGSNPETGVDPIQISAHIILALQAIQTREMAGTESTVITIGKINGGTQYNVIPDEVILEGTTRTIDDSVRHFLANRIAQLAKLTAQSFGGDCNCEFIWGAPPVVNDKAMTRLAANVLTETFGENYVQSDHIHANMAGEDFANYLQIVPGAFFFLSSSDPAKGTDEPHHSSRFKIDEDVLWKGCLAFELITQKYLSIE